MADQDQRGAGSLLPVIADCAGADGPATHLALDYGLGARHAADWVAALDELLAIAGAGGLDASAFGAQLGRMVVDRLVLLSRMVPSLRDAAQSAPTPVWQLVSAALPVMLPLMTVPRGLPDLLTLAAETAAAAAPAPAPRCPASPSSPHGPAPAGCWSRRAGSSGHSPNRPQGITNREEDHPHRCLVTAAT